MENRPSPIRDVGELPIEAQEPALAMKEFETSLRNNPNRYRSLAGAATAADRIGDRGCAKSYCEKLITLASDADTARPDLIAATPYLAGK